MRPISLLTTFLTILASCYAAAADGPQLAVVGNNFVVTKGDGSIVSGPALQGATLLASFDGQPLRIKIRSVSRDPDNPDLWLNDLVHTGKDGAPQPLCGPGPDGTAAAIPVTGTMRPNGTLAASPDGHFELTCTSGVQGKCVRFGYAPDKPAPAGGLARDGETTLRALYNTCILLVRADYGGLGAGTTKSGMLIDLYDDIGIQHPGTDKAADTPGLAFEAGFNEQGAVCVAHVRVAANTSLADLAAAYPRLEGHLGPDRCDEQRARALGATLFVRSRP